MAEYETNLRGAISQNQNKTQETHSDYSGKCEINGVGYYIDGWVTSRNDGSGSFLSLRFKPMAAAATGGAPVAAKSLGGDAPF